MQEPEVTFELAKTFGLMEEEYKRILEILGRKPSYTELGIYSVMWSEHCSYKNSILEIKKLPRSGGRLLVGAGEINAGLVDIGDGSAVAFEKSNRTIIPQLLSHTRAQQQELAYFCVIYSQWVQDPSLR